MAVYPLELTAPSLNVPRGHPCAAFLDQARAECGATPALLFRRVCAHQHARDLYLCKTHEAAVSRPGMATCRDCAGLSTGAHACPVALVAVPQAVGLIRAGRVPLAP
jgi:hypothetical protein